MYLENWARRNILTLKIILGVGVFMFVANIPTLAHRPHIIQDQIVYAEPIPKIKPHKPLKHHKKHKVAKKVIKHVVRHVSKPQVHYGGNCASWIRAAGISDVGAAQSLINAESGCNPYARNASSGACGVAQELPCGKSGCSLGDGACQVRWMNKYVLGVYGSWSNAWATWNSRSPHWY